MKNILSKLLVVLVLFSGIGVVIASVVGDIDIAHTCVSCNIINPSFSPPLPGTGTLTNVTASSSSSGVLLTVTGNSSVQNIDIAMASTVAFDGSLIEFPMGDAQLHGSGFLPMAASGTTTTLTHSQYSSHNYFELTGALSADHTIEVPDGHAGIIVGDNATTGGFSAIFKHAATSGVTITSAQSKLVLLDTGTAIESVPQGTGSVTSATCAGESGVVCTTTNSSTTPVHTIGLSGVSPAVLTAGTAVGVNTTGSAATLTTGRTISISGDVVYTSPAFDGSGNVTAAGAVSSVGGSTASAVHTAELLANAATSTNTASAIVKRDASGAFAASGVAISGGTFNQPSILWGTGSYAVTDTLPASAVASTMLDNFGQSTTQTITLPIAASSVGANFIWTSASSVAATTKIQPYQNSADRFYFDSTAALNAGSGVISANPQTAGDSISFAVIKIQSGVNAVYHWLVKTIRGTAWTPN